MTPSTASTPGPAVDGSNLPARVGANGLSGCALRRAQVVLRAVGGGATTSQDETAKPSARCRGGAPDPCRRLMQGALRLKPTAALRAALLLRSPGGRKPWEQPPGKTCTASPASTRALPNQKTGTGGTADHPPPAALPGQRISGARKSPILPLCGSPGAPLRVHLGRGRARAAPGPAPRPQAEISIIFITVLRRRWCNSCNDPHGEGRAQCRRGSPLACGIAPLASGVRGSPRRPASERPVRSPNRCSARGSLRPRHREWRQTA
eukprot:scaffold2871_cov381-Prasinococcus_capsulatus_cf.AAC.3